MVGAGLDPTAEKKTEIIEGFDQSEDSKITFHLKEKKKNQTC